MSDGQGYGGAAAAVGGVGLLYWIAIAVIHAAIISVLFYVFVAVMAIYIIYGVGKYIVGTGEAAIEGRGVYVVYMMAPLLLAPAGFLFGYYLTETRGVTPIFYTLEDAGFGALIIPYGILALTGWLWLGAATYEIRNDRGTHTPVHIMILVLWFAWALSWSLGLGSEGFHELTRHGW